MYRQNPSFLLYIQIVQCGKTMYNPSMVSYILFCSLSLSFISIIYTYRSFNVQSQFFHRIYFIVCIDVRIEQVKM